MLLSVRGPVRLVQRFLSDTPQYTAIREVPNTSKEFILESAIKIKRVQDAFTGKIIGSTLF